MQFLDENCIVFDNEEENKLEYTMIHAVSLKIMSINLYSQYFLRKIWTKFKNLSFNTMASIVI
jgi:hypothetical protein